MSVQWWLSVADADPTLYRHRVNVSCLQGGRETAWPPNRPLGCLPQSRPVNNRRGSLDTVPGVDTVDNQLTIYDVSLGFSKTYNHSAIFPCLTLNQDLLAEGACVCGQDGVPPLSQNPKRPGTAILVQKRVGDSGDGAGIQVMRWEMLSRQYLWHSGVVIWILWWWMGLDVVEGFRGW